MEDIKEKDIVLRSRSDEAVSLNMNVSIRILISKNCQKRHRNFFLICKSGRDHSL